MTDTPTVTLADLYARAAPRPWDTAAATHEHGGHLYLVDATGKKVGVIWGSGDRRKATADLIVALVNDLGGESHGTGTADDAGSGDRKG